jgi:hypothetical protein
VVLSGSPVAASVRNASLTAQQKQKLVRKNIQIGKTKFPLVTECPARQD